MQHSIKFGKKYSLVKYRIIMLCIISTFIVASMSQLYAQVTPPSNIVSDGRKYKAAVNSNTELELVSLQSIPGIVFDLRYTTSNNFTRQVLYPAITTTYLRSDAAKALQKVQADLNKQGLGLKIFDAYRPYSITQKMWKLTPDKKYVANPSKGSDHNRGMAVDLTIIDLTTKKELDMGTPFDSFSSQSHIDCTTISATAAKNRQLLQTVMQRYGFKTIRTEWWHFGYKDAKKYAVLDIGFEEL